MNKRLFELLDQMNQEDSKNGTQNVAVCNQFISADKVKAGTVIKMGAPEKYIFDIMNEKVIPLLILVDKAEFFKLKEK